MSDFLGCLAERSMGVAPSVQPVVPAITAPASKDTQFGEPESIQEVSEAPVEARPESEPRTARAVDAKRPALSDERQEPGAPPAPRRKVPVLAPERESGMREERAAVTEAALDSTVRNPAGAQKEEEAAGPPERAWNSTVSDPLSARGAEPMPRARREDAANQAPVIRVTIGRVEVRAEIGQTKARHAPARPKPAGLSLDEYLKQRGEGRR